MSSNRAFKRRTLSKDVGGDTNIPENHLQLPVGQVIFSTENLNGEIVTALPMYGWKAQRIREKTSIWVVVFSLMKDTNPCGVLQVELPIYPETELGTAQFLEKLGWDGRVWPKDEGWPSGMPEEEILKATMEMANLKNSLTFPPDSKGLTQTVQILVERSEGPFLMPPLTISSEEEVSYLSNLRDLSKKPWD